MSALKYVKWPAKSQFEEMPTKEEWECLDTKMREFIAEKIGDCDTKDAIFTLGELMASLHTQKTKTGNVKHQRTLTLQHDYVLFVYDHLFERIL
jgi:hypothetical protein